MSGTDEPVKTPGGTEQGDSAWPHLTYRHGHQAVRPGRVCAHQVVGHLGVEVEPAGREAVRVGQRLQVPISLPVSSLPTWCCRPSLETSCCPAPLTATPLLLFSLESPHPWCLAPSSLSQHPHSAGPDAPQCPQHPHFLSHPLGRRFPSRDPSTSPFPPGVPVPRGSSVSPRCPRGAAHPASAPPPLSTLCASDVQMLRHFQRLRRAEGGGGTSRSSPRFSRRKAAKEPATTSSPGLKAMGIHRPAGLPWDRPRCPPGSASPSPGPALGTGTAPPAPPCPALPGWGHGEHHPRGEGKNRRPPRRGAGQRELSPRGGSRLPWHRTAQAAPARSRLSVTRSGERVSGPRAGTGALPSFPGGFSSTLWPNAAPLRCCFAPKPPRQVMPVIVSLGRSSPSAAHRGSGPPRPHHSTGADRTSSTEKHPIALPENTLPTALLSLIPLSHV